MKWIVKVSKGRIGTPDYDLEYLVALRNDPYQRGGEHLTHCTSPYQSDAAIFRTRAAAEMSAVFCGGMVVRLKRRTP